MLNMNIAIIGYGKMGKEIESVAIERGHQISLIIHSKNKIELKNLNNYAIDIAIEFTRPSAAVENFSLLSNANIPIVTGTTG